ncbi:MAG: DEAD/DEAH box helicase [Bacteroidales bacterium]|nr:MAG: DEAD/DEAH box helicase [Bacteroidales bacterium]
MNFDKINLRYKKVSYHRQPDDLTIEEWQYALRKQFAENHFFRIEKQGKRSIFGDYNVYNPETKLSYKVALRSKDNSANFCECNDFKTNGLGTCKHIESVFHHIHNKLQKGAQLDKPYQPAYTSVYLDYRKGRKVRIRIGNEDSAAFYSLAAKYFDAENCLKESEFINFNQIIEQGLAINSSFRCYPDALANVLEHRENHRRSNLVNEKYAKHIDNGAFTPLINATLFPYQKEGICFAASKGRCIIADDMGLGKTIQAIAAAELLRKEMGISSVFIICPTSLKYQWKTEIEKFTGQAAWVIEGSYLKRQDQYRNDSFYKIISYNTAVNDIKELNATLPDLFILDEAQRIKNFKTKISQNIKRLKSPYTFVLTGTPLENKLEELYSIVQFVNPFALGPFWKYMSEYRILDEVGKLKGYQDLNRIGQKLSDTMIRRRKKDVLLQLPERMDKVLYVPMTEEQASVHTDCQESVSRLVHKWRRQGFLNEKDRQSLMIFLNMMRMVCDSTYILDQKTRFDTKIGELMNILDEVFAENEEKVVIFSQWERMTRLVAAELDQRNMKYQYLHGGIPSSDRGKLYDGFNNDPDCKVFLSTDAGGVGLNLQVASILINLDIPWNPAVLEQRIARIYRLGQKRNVSVINMVSTGTIEHKMLGVLSFKKGLSEGILDHGDSTVFMEDSKFKVLMNTVESIVEQTPAPEAVPQSYAETEEKQPVTGAILNEAIVEIEEHTKLPQEQSLDGDDDIPQNLVETSTNTLQDPETVSPTELVQMGISFFTSLTETLANPEATQKLISTIVQKDETDGKTYLKIPIENQKVVESAFALFAGLLSGIKK